MPTPKVMVTLSIQMYRWGGVDVVVKDDSEPRLYWRWCRGKVDDDAKVDSEVLEPKVVMTRSCYRCQTSRWAPRTKVDGEVDVKWTSELLLASCCFRYFDGGYIVVKVANLTRAPPILVTRHHCEVDTMFHRNSSTCFTLQLGVSMDKHFYKIVLTLHLT